MTKETLSVLVAGVQGVIGRAAAEHFASLPDLVVYGLSRLMVESFPGVRPIQVDLLSPEDVERVVAPFARCDSHHLWRMFHLDKQELICR